ncbi:N5-glutamine methyltransferase family protein [Pseudolysinimonas yzui]|uniref:Methylase n=1 Tax=Pseudolysinimonas yzui TaxID=2708254 RepID=A0A8J3GT74_9MICO|nr:HemK/PrmC family methyltransferase [Pseudolysinimonas yzui]GHF26237.1 methylase [Pseudolysinimonas yzui]
MPDALASDPLIGRLREVGCVFAEEEAAEIRRVVGDDEQRADAVVAARGAGIPLEHALGVALFAGVEIEVGPGVFVPRARAEVLVDAAVAARPDARVVVDLGTGSGAIAAALATRLPRAAVYGVDLDPHALAYAVRNAARHHFTVHEGDWWDALPHELRGRVDLAVAYLPHVPTARLADIPGDYRAHEPDLSVAGGPDGLDPLRHVLADLDEWLTPDGVLVTLVAEEQLETARALSEGRRLTLVVG